MEIPEDFERIHPGFELATFIPEQTTMPSNRRHKLPWSRSPHQFERSFRLLSSNLNAAGYAE